MPHDYYFSHNPPSDKKRDEIWKIIARYLQNELPINSTVMDIGAGRCNFINNIKAGEKHALDVFDEIRKHANRNVITHVQPSSSMKNLKSDYFDTVFASNFFEHLTRGDVKKTLTEVRRMLKPGGKLIIIQPNFKYAYRDYWDDYTHITPFTHVGMMDLLASYGFSITKCIPRFLPFSMKSRLRSLHCLMKLYLYFPIKPQAKQMLIIAKKGSVEV